MGWKGVFVSHDMKGDEIHTHEDEANEGPFISINENSNQVVLNDYLKKLRMQNPEGYNKLNLKKFEASDSKRIKLWIDDERNPANHVEDSDSWTWAKSADEAIKHLSTGLVDTVSFDHDLGEPKDTNNGYQVIKWIEEQVYTNPSYNPPGSMNIHTQNVSGRGNIQRAIQSIQREMERRTK